MSYSDSPIFVVKKRLTEWGHWSYQLEIQGLSYSRESIFAQMAREKEALALGTDAAFYERIEEIEALLEEMLSLENNHKEKVEWLKVIRIHYTRFHESLQSKLQLSHLSKTTYYHYLNDAHAWLSHQLFLQ